MKTGTNRELASFIILAGICSAFLVGCRPKQPESWVLPADFHPGVARDGNLKQVLERVRAANNLPALAAISMTSTGIIELASTGVRAVGFPEQVTDDDQWHLGSITKPMTATVAARLVERGLISWDTKIGEAIPELAGTMRAEYREVTLTDLLRHESGLPRDVPSITLESVSGRRGLPKDIYLWMPQSYDPNLSATENRLKAAALILAGPPAGARGKPLYSNAGFMIAGLMLERVARIPFEDLFRRELLEPLGMKSSDFGAPGTPGKRDQPWGHWPAHHWYGDSWCPLDPGNPYAEILPTESPNGRVHASLQDMAKFAMAHLAGERGESSLLSASSFKLLHTADASQNAVDWGVFKRDWGWGRYLAHSGSTARWYAMIGLAPNRDLAIFAACNGRGENGEKCCDQAMQVLIDRVIAAEPPRIKLDPANPVPGSKVTLTYLPATGPLAGARHITLHDGVNGWKAITDTPMSETTDGNWEAVLNLSSETRQIDFVFTEGTKWDNNSGLDWHVAVHPGLSR